MVESKGKIYLADERRVSQANWFRSFNTFNFGKYFNEHKTPFGNIYVVNDDSLDAGRSLRMTIEEYSHVILLPVMGAISYKDSLGGNLVAAGQIEILTMKRNEKIEMTNPFKEGLVNFLQVWIKSDKPKMAKESNLLTYDVNESLNSLIQISAGGLESPLPFNVSVGKFNGRAETTYQLKNKDTGLFVFVIEGVFEVAGRLLHARDSLALWEINEMEVEALSNNAIVLVIETPLNNITMS